MNFIESIKAWLIEHPGSASVIKYLLWLTVILGVIRILQVLLRKNLPESTARFKSQRGIQIIGFVFIILLTITYFTGNIKDLTLAIGLLTAGITITLQELILSVAGFLYIFFLKVYAPGDRIEINGIKGDVIDIDSVYTTMMEIGQWVSSDNYSGRIVKLSNAFVFKGPVYNYSRDFPFIWDEFNLPVRYGSDIELAKSVIIRIATEELSGFVKESISSWKDVVDKYYIEDAIVEPTLATSMTDNWIQFNLRYIVNYKKRRMTKHRLQERIAKAFLDTGGKVELASATFEVVRLPDITVRTQAADQKPETEA